MKITFGLIVFNGDFLLKQVLETIYPHAHKICIAEGPVDYWVKRGHKTSNDDTNKILRDFLDPEEKIIIKHGQWAEKSEMCQAWFENVPEDTDYVFCVDGDEIHPDIPKIIDFLEKVKPASVGFKSNTFFGGLDHTLDGFEAEHSFKRILKYVPGCYYKNHRPPTLALKEGVIEGDNISGEQLYAQTGITMWHGSYVSPRQVKEKIDYYEAAVIAKGKCIPGYFQDVFVKWIKGDLETRKFIERRWLGVHEFHPTVRGKCYPVPFTGKHPDIIKRDMSELMGKFNQQLEQYGR